MEYKSENQINTGILILPDYKDYNPAGTFAFIAHIVQNENS
jgi:hypothetical protein